MFYGIPKINHNNPLISQPLAKQITTTPLIYEKRHHPHDPGGRFDCAASRSWFMKGDPATVSIREASSADLDALLGLYALLEFGSAQSLSLEAAGVRFKRYLEYPNYRIYVAELGEAIVGTFALIIVDSVAHSGKPFGVVEDVVVSQDWQSRGIGKLMMKFAMSRCKEFGCYKLALSSHLKRPEAHAFYESLGFEKHGFSFLIT